MNSRPKIFIYLVKVLTSVAVQRKQTDKVKGYYIDLGDNI